MARASGPLSHEEIFDAADCDKASVFRVLRDLTAAGLLNRFDAGDHVWRFELAERATVTFCCSTCNTVTKLPKAPRLSLGKVTSLIGVCNACG